VYFGSFVPEYLFQTEGLAFQQMEKAARNRNDIRERFPGEIGDSG
jgi:hypothetical protein